MSELEGLEEVIKDWGQRHYVCNRCGYAFTIASDPNHDDGGASLKTLWCSGCGVVNDFKQVSELPEGKQ